MFAWGHPLAYTYQRSIGNDEGTGNRIRRKSELSEIWNGWKVGNQLKFWEVGNQKEKNVGNRNSDRPMIHNNFNGFNGRLRNFWKQTVQIPLTDNTKSKQKNIKEPKIKFLKSKKFTTQLV